MTGTFDAEMELRRHGAALRALALALLSDRDAADDVVQQTWLRAVERPPRHGAAAGAWLATVLRHLASRWRRAERRRLRRHQAAACSEAVEGAAAAVAREEMLQRVVDAVRQLESPYREVVCQRFFAGQKPAAIAEHSGVPLATVKSRLQRGLAQLRVQLRGARQEGEWRTALASAFGIGGEIAVAAATGAGLMGTATKMTFAAAAVVMAAAWWLLQSNVGPSPAVGTGTAVPITAVAAAPAAIETDSVQRVEMVRPVAMTDVGPQRDVEAHVRGRCVDDRGAPLTGVDISLVNGCEQAAGEPTPQIAPSLQQTTAADGTFRFALQPLPRSRMLLRFSRTGCCLIHGEVRDLLPGADEDLGDVLLPAAIFVQGHVRDTDGQPIAGATVSAWNASATRPRMFPDGSSKAVSSEDGSYGPLGPLPPGPGFAMIDGRRLAQSTPRLQLDFSAPLVELDLVVRSDGELPPIRGVVVDERGAAVVGALVTFLEEFMVGSKEQTVGVRTAADGSFTLRATENPAGDGPFALHAEKIGFAPVDTRPIALGSTDTRIVLPHARDLIVRVRWHGDEAPVVAFALDLVPRVPQCELRRLEVATWPDGVARVPAVKPGQYLVHVAPSDAGLQPSGFVPVEVAAEQDTEVIIELGVGHRRLLRLRDGSGAPIEAEVELIDPWGQQVRFDSFAFSLADCIRLLGRDRLLLLQQGHTDARGELRLCGPSGRDLALRLRGSDVAPQIASPVRFDDDAPLDLTVMRGAVWTGRVVPASVAAALLDAMPTQPRTLPNRRVGIELQRDGDDLLRPMDPLFVFARDGSFRIASIPPGTWQVVVRALGEPLWVADLTVREGEEIAQDLDLHRLQPCAVDLQLFVNGSPWAKQRVMLEVDHGAADADHAWGERQEICETDAMGRVRWLSLPGRLGCRLWIPDGDTAFHVLPPPLQIPEADHFERVLDLHTGRLQLRVLRPDGAPAAGVELQLTDLGWSEVSLNLDAESRCSVPALQGRHHLRVWPRRLAASATRESLARTNGEVALQADRLDLGEVEVGGQTAPCEIRLPLAWDR